MTRTSTAIAICPHWIRPDLALKSGLSASVPQGCPWCEIERLQHDLTRAMANHVADLNSGAVEPPAFAGMRPAPEADCHCSACEMLRRMTAEKPSEPDDDSAHVRPGGPVVATAIYTPVQSSEPAAQPKGVAEQLWAALDDLYALVRKQEMEPEFRGRIERALSVARWVPRDAVKPSESAERCKFSAFGSWHCALPYGHEGAHKCEPPALKSSVIPMNAKPEDLVPPCDHPSSWIRRDGGPWCGRCGATLRIGAE